MTADLVVVPHSAELVSVDIDLEQSLNVLLYSLADASRRVYAHTFQEWLAFAREHDLDPTAFSPANIIAFLTHKPLSKSGRQNRLAHLRRLVTLVYAAHPTDDRFQSYYLQLKELKIKATEHDKATQKTKQALKAKEVHRALATWQADTRLAQRNAALLAVLFYTGLRRSEAAALQWNDIDLEQGLVRVRHGKGDKERTTPILSEDGVEVLRVWRAACPAERMYVFPAFRKGDHLGADTPMTTESVYQVVKASGDFSPHDARRTLITDALAAGSSVADVQYVAGHANAATTLRYAQVKDAKEVKGRVKLTY